jgi:energy-coupling factor transporter ATP-binding protein EcfA2
MRVLLKNIRSFCRGKYSIPIRPLTILVGENSTGKSTFLALLAHLTQGSFPSLRPSLSDPPFDLGTFDSIATYKGGRFGRAESFSIGFTKNGKRDRGSVFATYRSHLGQPQLSSLEMSHEQGEVSLTLKPDTLEGTLILRPPKGKEIKSRVDFKHRLSLSDIPVPYLLRAMLFDSNRKDIPRSLLKSKWILGLVAPISGFAGPAIALAPVRTKPKRTYDEINDDFKPEGDHIPAILARIWRDEDSSRRSGLLRALGEFGAGSALFKNIGVKRLGKRPSDPYQILVTVAGPPTNLLDVGYGVSQSLPLVVESVLADEHRILLMQEPEVHLHPRAQAALGSFFAHLVAAEKRHFVIETHSDYLLDRVRQEVARKTIRAQDVQILFFERSEAETIVHEIRLDKLGNVVKAPPSYRSFFLEEDLRLLNRKDR